MEALLSEVSLYVVSHVPRGETTTYAIDESATQIWKSVCRAAFLSHTAMNKREKGTVN